MSAYGRLWEQARLIRERLERLAPGCTQAPIQQRIDQLTILRDDLIKIEKQMAVTED